jgi:hypothetical protein
MAVLNGGGKLEGFLAGIASRLKRGDLVRVGFLENSTYPDGTPTAMVAAIQNFGAPARGIPPRPFFSNAIRDNSPKWGDELGKVLKAANYDGARALGLMGERIAGQIRVSINETTEPALSPLTVAAKGFAKPLIDTGHMWNSIAYEVRAGGGSSTYIDAKGSGAYAEGDVSTIGAAGGE